MKGPPMPRSFLLFALLLCLPSAARAQRVDRLEKLAARFDTVGAGNFSIHTSTYPIAKARGFGPVLNDRFRSSFRSHKVG
jgi:hypothetical protein